MSGLDHILVRPIISEKASSDSEINNRYGFVVNINANKFQVKAAVEKLYDVKVLDVKTNVRPGKLKRAGKKIKKLSSFKRAFVQIEKGQKIELFKSI